METNNETKVYFDSQNKVVIETIDNKIILEQKQAKIAMLKLYDMFTDPRTAKHFPELNQEFKDSRIS